MQVYQSERLYVKIDGKYRWVKTEAIFNKMGLDWDWKKRKFISAEEIAANLGKPISEWPEPEAPPYEARPLFILGSCLPTAPVGDAVDWGINAFIGNHENWPHYANIRDAGAKAIVCINAYYVHPETGKVNGRPFTQDDVDDIQERVRYWLAYFGPDGIGGWWSSTSRGEEPDAQAWGTEEYALIINESRKLFKKTVRQVDLDDQNHPLIEQFDLTHKGVVGGAWRAGWELCYLDKEACDLVIFDMYARNCSKQEVWDAVHKYWEHFPGAFCSNQIQVVPQFACYDYRPGIFHDLMWAYEDVLGPKMGLAFYSDEIIRPQDNVQQEIKEVVAECRRAF